MDKIKVLMASSECFPYARTGGLSEVIPALSEALNSLTEYDMELSIVIPYYGSIKSNFEESKNFKKEDFFSSIKIEDKEYDGYLYSTELFKGIKLYFVENDYFYKRDSLYGDKNGDYTDNTERFYFFSRFVIDMAEKDFLLPDVMHIHDWHTALIPAMIKSSNFASEKLKNVKTLLTIHNLGYQGMLNANVKRWAEFKDEDFPEDVFGPLSQNHDRLNFLKTGIVFSDKINTVSPNYAKEIQTSVFGFGLERLLRKRSEDLSGVLNGGDYLHWDPESDKKIPQNFSLEDLSGKRECKKKLSEYFEFKYEEDVPIISVVTRLTYQKGLDLLRAVWDEFLELPMKFVILGDGDKDIETFFLSYAREYPDKIGVRIGFDENLAHLIQAGSDMFLMPSRYEPCGLTQIHAMKYGTIPIVRSTGGLEDTVMGFDEESQTGDGFKFFGIYPNDMMFEIKRALRVYHGSKESWGKIMETAMKNDFSYKRAAYEYAKLYSSMLS